MVKQVLIALDQLVNSLLGGFADESISARAYRCKWVVAERAINALFCSNTHCQDSYESERRRMQLPPEYRSR